jgi:hypothetical protein
MPLNFKIAFSNMAIFMILFGSVHECGRIAHLLVSSSISFFSVLHFLKMKSGCVAKLGLELPDLSDPPAFQVAGIRGLNNQAVYSTYV